MVETAEKKPDAQTDVKDRDEGAPTGSLTSKLALGPTPTLAPAVSPLAPPPASAPAVTGAPTRLAQMYGAPTKAAPAPTPAPAPGPAPTVAAPPVVTPTPETLTKQQMLRMEMETYKRRQEQEQERLKWLREEMQKKRELEKQEAEEAARATTVKINAAQKAQDERDKWKYPETKLSPYKPPAKTSLPEQWGSVAMIFAMLGSAMTRNRAVTALDAATGAMKGFQQADKDKAEEAYNVWKTQNDNLLKSIQFDLERRRDAFEGIKSAEELEKLKGTAKYAEIQARVKATSTALNDENSLRIQESQGIEGDFKHLESMTRLAEDIDKTTKAQNLRKQVGDLVNKPGFINADPKDQLKQLMDLGYQKNIDEYADAAVKAAEEKIKASDKTLTPLQQDRKELREKITTPGTKEYENYMRAINAMAFYNEKFPSLRDGAGPEEQADHYQRLADVFAVNPDFHEDYYGRAAVLNSHWTDLQYKPAQMINNLNTVGGHLGEMKELVRLLEARRNGAFDEGQLALVNKIRSGIASAFGVPIKEVTDVKAAAPIVMDEIFKLIVNGAGTGPERKELQALLDPNQPLSKLKSNLDVQIDLLGSRVESMQTSYVNSLRAINPKMTTEQARKQFVQALNPSTIVTLGDYLHMPSKELAEIRKKVGAPTTEKQALSGTQIRTPTPENINLFKQNKDDPTYRKFFEKNFGKAKMDEVLGAQ